MIPHTVQGFQCFVCITKTFCFHFQTLINFEIFNLLPKHYQYHLVKLLPEVDQEVGSKGELTPTATAFSNEFFTSAFESWKDRLSEGTSSETFI